MLVLSRSRKLSKSKKQGTIKEQDTIKEHGTDKDPSTIKEQDVRNVRCVQYIRIYIQYIQVRLYEMSVPATRPYGKNCSICTYLKLPNS
jgi:hypothetical protein